MQTPSPKEYLKIYETALSIFESGRTKLCCVAIWKACVANHKMQGPFLAWFEVRFKPESFINLDKQPAYWWPIQDKQTRLDVFKEAIAFWQSQLS